MRLTCPHCGERPSEEFTYRGDANVSRPATNDPASMDRWFDYVYLRENPRGVMEEFWHHSGGCRSWFVARRNTETHEVLGSTTAQDYVKGRRK